MLVERARPTVNVSHPRDVSATVLRLLDALQRRDAGGNDGTVEGVAYRVVEFDPAVVLSPATACEARAGL